MTSSAFALEVTLGNRDSVLERVNVLGVNRTRSNKSGDEGDTSCGTEFGIADASSAGLRGVDGREMGVSPMSSSSSGTRVGGPDFGIERYMTVEQHEVC